MSTDLKAQIRDLASMADAGQRPVTVAEVRDRLEGRDDTEPVVRPAGSESVLSRGAWPAVVAAAVVLIIFGVFAWVFPADEAPPADSLPDSMDREVGYYAPSFVPDEFVLQDISASEFNRELFYLRETSDAWSPEDGGFQLGDPLIGPGGLPQDAEEFLAGIVEANPEAMRVEVRGRPGVIQESEYLDGPVATALVSLVVVDERGGVFEIAASGMTREEVLSVGEGVERVSVDEFVDLGTSIEWDFRISGRHDGFEYEIPADIRTLAGSVDVVVGLDVLARTSLARSDGNEATVVTTDDGSIVETEERSWSSSVLGFYLDVPDEDVEQMYETLRQERVTVSPSVANELTDRYLEKVSDGVVLSEDPYVIQAPRGPEPQFDTSSLGEEMPLEPAESADVLPETMFGERFGPEPPATRDRPVIIIGTATRQPSGADPLTAVLWFTQWGGVDLGETRGGGMGSSGGTIPLHRYGISGESRSSRFAVSDLSYSVPLETSVVQFITDEGTFWQRPIAGYGVISQKYTEDPRPTSLIAFDSDGDRIGEWEVPDY